MNQFVQSAIEAAKQGDNNKALAFLKQVLNANPNDVDAWLVLAAVVDDPQRKRQCLNRVLKLDPVNQVAREELMEMDRAEMDSMPPFIPDVFDQAQSFGSDQDEPVYAPTSQPRSANVYTTKEPTQNTPTQAKHVSLKDWPQDTLKQTDLQSSSKPLDDKPQVFRYPLMMRILIYFFVVVPGCGGLLIATQSLSTGMFFLGIGLLMLVIVLFLSPKVEVRDSGIRVATVFSGNEVPWDGITKIKTNTMKRRLELFRKNGDVVKVSTQVSGYPQIVEILRKRRPDLFGSGQTASISTSAFESDNASMSNTGANPTPTFAGDRIFKKSFLRQYGSFFYLIPACLVVTWLAYAGTQYRTAGTLSMLFCLVMMALPLFQVNTVKVEQKKLTIESLFEQKVFSAKEIREIKMQTARGRYGSATNFVNILPIKGKNYPLQGFSEGDEIIYGVLMNWWIAHRGG